MVENTKEAYISVQRVKISKNRHFVFKFTSQPVLTVFFNRHFNQMMLTYIAEMQS